MSDVFIRNTSGRFERLFARITAIAETLCPNDGSTKPQRLAPQGRVALSDRVVDSEPNPSASVIRAIARTLLRRRNYRPGQKSGSSAAPPLELG
ncbi:MAG: hypothetical protein CMH58_10050 [Myxococcales bacterium]|nr:hypothetical protein [Myxococcales bacterium]